MSTDALAPMRERQRRQRPRLDDTVCDRARGPGDEVDRLFKSGGLDDREPRDRWA